MKPFVLITGGNGYIGGRLAVHLHNNGYPLRIATRKKIKKLDWIPDAEVVTLDLEDADSVAAACKTVEVIIHLAAMNEIDCVKHPDKALITNTVGTYKILEKSIQMGVERFIYFSTAHVYGAPLTGTLTEQSVPRPVHPYAITHHAAEEWVLAAHDKKNINGTVLRLSNGIGAPVVADVNRWTLVANDLCRQAIKQKKLSLISSGRQKRDFVTLRDVENAVEHFINLPREVCGDGLFNLGGKSSIAIIELANLIAERCRIVFGYKPVVYTPDSVINDEIYPLEYSIEKLKKTGFELSGSLIKEIDETLIFCDKNFNDSK